jgi:outer membrane protein assembly factor BamB
MLDPLTPRPLPLRATGLSLAFTIALAGSAAAADWPQYRGPNHDGKSPESVAPWPAAGPKIAWKIPTPTGFSSFAVSGGKAFTLVRREMDGADREVCLALEAVSGKELWATPVGIAKYQGGGDDGKSPNKGGDGPRSTPSIAGDRVLVFNAQLRLVDLDAATGKEVWAKELIKEFKGANIGWENAASPLVDGELVFVAGGGSGAAFLAFHIKDGTVAWQSGEEKITHASPVAATIAGTRQIIFFMQSGLVAVAADSGKELWRYAFPYRVSTAASPVVGGDIVYCSAGYGVGSAAVKITKADAGFTVTELWRLKGDKPVASHWSTPIFHDGHLYGMFSFKEYGDGPLKCVELATGQVKWEKPGFGPGNVTLASNRLIALSDAGEVVLVEAKPDAYAEVARAKVLDGKCWSTPTLSGGRIYVRSTKEGVCLDAAGK